MTVKGDSDEELVKDLETLENEIRCLEEAMKGHTNSLNEGQNKLKALRNRAKPIQQRISRLETGRASQEAQASASQQAIEGATEFHKSLLAKLEAELPKGTQEDIEKARKPSPEIEKMWGAIEEIDKKISTQAELRQEKQKEAKEAEARVDSLLQEIQLLPQALKEISARVAKLRAAVETAAKAGQVRKSYYLALQLKDELASSEEFISAQEERSNELHRQVNETWRKAKEANNESAQAEIKLQELREKRLEKEAELKEKEQERNRELEDLLTSSLVA